MSGASDIFLINKVTLKGTKRPSVLLPDFMANTVQAIDFATLKKFGIKACFIDLDGTVVHRGTYDVELRTAKAIRASGLDFYIATNRPVSRVLKNLVSDLSAKGVVHPHFLFAKPTRYYFEKGLKRYNLKPREVVMIGDRYFQDIFGANRTGLYSLLVDELGESKILSKLQLSLTKIIRDKYIKAK